MLRKNYLRAICVLICIFATFSMLSLEAFARDDNPLGNYLAEFPTPSEVSTNNYIMTSNKGTIQSVKTPGEILYNFGTISSLEGATVQENCKDATITKALNGTVKVNKGTIELINNSAVIELNAVGGVINQNLNKINQNMGTVKENYSTIEENRGSIETVAATGTVSKHIEGTIGSNQGKVTVVPDSKGIVTAAIIENNSGTVYVEADADEKSTVKVINNTNRLVIKSGADCIVENNSGTVEIEDGGKCILTGTNTGTLPDSGVVKPGGEYYKLILDNISRNDIQMVSNYKIENNEIYVLKDKNFSFTIDESKYSVTWSDDATIHSANVEFIRTIDEKYVDDTNQTVKLHIHTLGSYTPSETELGYHEITCNACNKLAKFEVCSGGTATCKEVAKCAKCGHEYGSTSEHSYGAWKSNDGKHWKECIWCGIKAEEEACSGGTATCKELAKCVKCGKGYGSLSKEHSFGKWIIQKDAGIGVEGTKYRKCSVCGFKESKAIPAKPAAEEPQGGDTPFPNSSNNNSGNNKNVNNVSAGKKAIKQNETLPENAKNDDNTDLQEEVQTDTEAEVQDEPQSDTQSDVFSKEELSSDNEEETDSRSDEVLTDDALSIKEPDSKESGVKWPLVVVGSCFVVAAAAVAVVTIKKKSKS